MPCTPWRSTSSATRKASTIEVVLSSTVSRRELGMVMSVSTSAARSSTPTSAWAPRRAPSKANGLVTMPTVSAPTSRAMRATTGAAPVPVPPPAPAVMKIMSAPLSRLLTSSYCSMADCRPSCGSEPEPSPRVEPLPMCTRGRRAGPLERLEVGVQRDELHALDLGLDHAVDGVHAGAAHAHHAQDGLARERRGRLVGGLALVAVAALGLRGGPGSRSIMFSGMSAEKTLLRRSDGDGTVRARARGARAGSARARPARGGPPRAARARRPWAPAVLLGLAEEGRQGALAHARPLTACHVRGPP